MLLLVGMVFVLQDSSLLNCTTASGEMVWGYKCSGPCFLRSEPGLAVISSRTSQNNCHCEEKLQHHRMIEKQISPKSLAQKSRWVQKIFHIKWNSTINLSILIITVLFKGHSSVYNGLEALHSAASHTHKSTRGHTANKATTKIWFSFMWPKYPWSFHFTVTFQRSQKRGKMTIFKIIIDKKNTYLEIIDLYYWDSLSTFLSKLGNLINTFSKKYTAKWIVIKRCAILS